MAIPVYCNLVRCEEDHLEREGEETLAKLLRLRKQKKFHRTRGKEMLRRGLSTMDELDKVEEQEQIEAQAREKALGKALAASSTPSPGSPSGSADFVDVAMTDNPSRLLSRMLLIFLVKLLRLNWFYLT